MQRLLENPRLRNSRSIIGSMPQSLIKVELMPRPQLSFVLGCFAAKLRADRSDETIILVLGLCPWPVIGCQRDNSISRRPA